MMETSNPGNEGSAEKQLRPGLWQTVNERYPGSMITNTDHVPLAKLSKPVDEARFCFVSTSGVQTRDSMPFDTVHPVGDYTFRRVPSNSHVSDLTIHQLKYPTFGANEDLNVIFPIERLRQLVDEKLIGGITQNFYTFIGYNMDPSRLETTLAEDLADAIAEEQPDGVIAAPA